MTDNNEIPEYGTPGAEGSGTSSSTSSERPDAKVAWSEAGERLGGLGNKLKAHYNSQTDTSAGGAEVKEAAKRLGEAVEAAFQTIGVAAKDKAVQDDVKQVGRSVADALVGTFAGLSDEMKKTFGKQESTTSTTEAPPTASTTETPPPPAPAADPPTGPGTPPPGSTS